ncbi:diacylglycerol O-acyltransferase 2-like [Daktulosphaira vitifoliae]|uniref:diacylglycerol O-acyltransferase 2-like n=1 Tax=Daktulosphaira vitifoliae TaxID=58002 RepID=UPI0021A9C16E|nr:diacylglycerol O-acyltransferase 2-like [Daktulosphaira vitifoliae]
MKYNSFIPFGRWLEVLAAATGVYMSMFSGILESVVLLYYTCYYNPRLYWISLLYICWMFYDRKSSTSEKRSFSFMRNFTIWYYFRCYFPATLVKTHEIPPDKNYLFVVHPHGLLGWGYFCNLIVGASPFKKYFPGIKTYLHILKIHFYIPFHREYAIAIGFRDPSEEALINVLNGETGNASILLVGGVEEAFKSYPGPIPIVLKKRKGFIRIALKTGASLVPVFSFGENNVYKKQVLETDSILYKFLKLFRWKGDRIVPEGRHIFCFKYTLIPRRHPIFTVVGKPINLPKIQNPSEEDIKKYHEIYTQELIKLFEENKHKYTKNPEDLYLMLE